MSHFYGEVNGASRTNASRRGHKNTGIMGHIRGCVVGGRVACAHVNGFDRTTISLTAGSSYGRSVPNAVVVATDSEAGVVICHAEIEGWLCIKGDYTATQKEVILAAARLIGSTEQGEGGQ